MHRIIWFALGLLLSPSLVWAQSDEKVSFKSVRIGFTNASSNADEAGAKLVSLYKVSEWVPVFVEVLNNGKYDAAKDGPITVSLSMLDCDETINTYTVPLPPFDPQTQSASAILYTRPGTRYGDFNIELLAKGRPICKPSQNGVAGLGSGQVIFVSLGSRGSSLSLPVAATAGKNNALQFPMGALGVIARVSEMPPDWFGFGSADVVVLSTADRGFLTDLANDQTGRRAALLEWVRRGGRLIVHLGSNRDIFLSQPEFVAALPATVDPKPYFVPSLPMNWLDGASSTVDPLKPAQGAPGIELTRFSQRESRSFVTLLNGPGESSSPVVVQGPHGLGQITLVGFDLDTAPFTQFKGREQFSSKLLQFSSPRYGPIQSSTVPFGVQTVSGDSEMASIVQQTENFEGVPVISFGWVALFILLYILIVGPLDYLFLKKVVKRLELTWITFPAIVLAVSTAAYFAAYYLKGSDLRINKMDFVDYDPATQRVYGRSWFSIFSPRIQKYTVGVEPASPGWSLANDPINNGTVVSWMGVAKQGRESLFRNSYNYATKAEALVGVPIQVWSTKGFDATWAAPIDKSKAPIDGSRLRHPPGKPNELIGSVVSHLPVPLEQAILIYRGEVAELGRIEPETPKSVTAQNRLKFAAWRDGAGAQKNPQLAMNILFHDAMLGQRTESSNGGMRTLDQSWRIRESNRNEAIIVGVLPKEQGKSEEMTSGLGMPLRLWIGEVPKAGAQRPPISGVMRQETVVRAFLPIPAEPDAK